MKKLLSMLVALFMSLLNGTDYIITADKPYTETYYTVDEADPPDYRTYYGTVSTSTATENCKTTNYSADGKHVDNSQGYWFVNNRTVSLETVDSYQVAHHVNNDPLGDVDYYVAQGCFTDGSYIIMPYTGTLQSESLTNDCTSMVVYCTALSGVEYKLVISNMSCWYCDVGRVDSPTYHTSSEQNGKKFQAGNVLGRATSNTTIKVIPISNGSSIGTATLSEFYSGTYTSPDET